MSTSSNKKKATARKNATARIAERPGTGGRATVPASEKERSQSRHPGETPLTGVDRPANKPTGKVEGQLPQNTKRKR